MGGGGGVLLGNKCFLYVGHNYWHPIIATSFPQDNSSEFSPIMPEEFGEHLTRDQRSLRLDIFYFCCDGGNGDFNCVSLFLTDLFCEAQQTCSAHQNYILWFYSL